MKILKRSFSLMAAIAVFICSFALPASAIDISSDGSGQVMRPLFDYDYLELYYDGGYHAVFNLKDVFYNNFMSDKELTYSLTDTTGQRSVTFTLVDVDFEQPNVSIGGQFVKLPYWVLSFEIPLEFITDFRIGCSESIYDYDILSNVYLNYKDSFRFYDVEHLNVDTPFRCRNDSSFYYPVFSYDSDTNVIVGRSLQTKDLSHSSDSATGSYPIGPFVNLDSLVSLMPSDYSSTLLYFSDFSTSVTIPRDSYYLEISVCYIPESNVSTFKEYHDLYFPAYRVDNAAVDFTGWIATAVGGFLSFEFIPGISFSTLLLFMLGIGAFVAFLKFFAGG